MPCQIAGCACTLTDRQTGGAKVVSFRQVAVQVVLAALAFCLYLAIYIVLDGVGLKEQREAIISITIPVEVIRLGGLAAAIVAALWATARTILSPGEYSLKLAFVVLGGIAIWYVL